MMPTTTDATGWRASGRRADDDARTTTARRLRRPSHAARLASRRDDRVRARDASEILDADGRLGRGGGSREIGRVYSFIHSFIHRAFVPIDDDRRVERTDRSRVSER